MGAFNSEQNILVSAIYILRTGEKTEHGLKVGQRGDKNN